MKKPFLLFFLFAGILLTAFVAPKIYTIRFDEPQIQFHWQNLEMIKQVVDQSQLPHNQVKFIVSSIDSLQRDMQVNLKIDSVKGK